MLKFTFAFVGAFLVCLLHAGGAAALEINNTQTITDPQSGYIRIDTTEQGSGAVTVTFNGSIGRAPDSNNSLLIRAKGESNGNNNDSDLIQFNETVVTDYIGVNGGNSQVHFMKRVDVAGGLNLDDNLNDYKYSHTPVGAPTPRVWFQDAVTAQWVRVGDGLTTTQFDGDLSITGYAEGDVSTALSVSRGNTVFNGNVVTNGGAEANVVIAGVTGQDATATFNRQLGAGNASIYIGGSEALDPRKRQRGDTDVFVAATGGVSAANMYIGVQGSNAGDAALHLAAGSGFDVGNVYVSDNGAIENNTVMDMSGGNLVFGTGSAYEHDGLGNIVLKENAAMYIHGGATAATATDVVDMFDRTSLDASSFVRFVGETGDARGYVAGDVNLAAGNKGYVDVVNNMTVAGAVNLNDMDSRLRVLSGANDVDAVFKDTVDAGSLYVGSDGGAGTTRALFEDAVSVDGGVRVATYHDGYAGRQDNVHFKGGVDAAHLSLDSGTGTNTFDGAIVLDGYDAATAGVKKGTFVVSNLGHNVFNGAVDTTSAFHKPTGVGETGGHAIFAASATGNPYYGMGEAVSEINNSFDVGNANIYVGYNDNIPGSAAYLPVNRVVLGSRGGNSGHLKGSNIYIEKNGHLELATSAGASGHLVFENGAYYSPNGHTLRVNGDVDIQRGAILYMDPTNVVDSERVILDTTDGIAGDGFKGLYRTSLSEDGRKLSVTGINTGDVVYRELFGTMSENTVNAGNMFTSVMLNEWTPADLRTNMATSMQRAAGYAYDNPGLARAAFAQLFGEHGLAGATAARTTARSFAGSVIKHQTMLREQGYSAPGIAGSGSGYASLPYAPREYAPTSGYNYDYVSTFNPNRLWAGGFGSWTRQDNRGAQFGYDYNSGGAILGYDRDLGNFVFGLAAAYSRGTVDNNEGYSKTDVDTLNVGLYASYNYGGGFFMDGHLGFGYSWNETNTTEVFSGLRKEGDYNSYSYQAGLDFGYRFDLPMGLRIIPSVGAHYTRVHQRSWYEKGQAPGMLLSSFDSTADNYFSIPLSLKLNKTFLLGSVGSLTPELRGSWIYEAKDPRSHVRMGYVGSFASTTLFGVDSGRSRALVGAGLKARFNYHLDAFVDYNFEFRSGYRNHNLMGGLGWSF